MKPGASPASARAQMPRSVTRCEQSVMRFSSASSPNLLRGREMVDLKIVCRSAVLAAPSVALEHLAAQATIRFRLKP